MPIEKFTPRYTFTEDRLEQLKQVVPEAFADGKINWDTLKEVLGEFLEEEGAEVEHFGLTWPGKRQARRVAALPSKGALSYCPEEGINAENSEHVFIEGDNLEVLKLMQKAYAGRVKLIYIDPPYNTGNDFVYKDNYSEPLDDYLRKIGQKGDGGEILTSNPKSSGRFHSNWLNMIYPRLRLARNLLREDGLLFVSIDDTEVANLRRILDDIFGEDRRIAQLVWKNKYNAGALTKGFSSVHEYVLCYAKSEISNITAPLGEEEISQYKGRDSKFSVRGGFVTQPLSTSSKDDRPNLYYPITIEGRKIWPEKQWIWSKDRVESAILNDEVVVNEKSGKTSVRVKQYLKNENGNLREMKPVSILVGPFNQEGTKEVAEIFGSGGVFAFPKPVNLLRYLISLTINDEKEENAIILDFFAGSGTSGSAILAQNAADGLNRRFILVQLPTILDSNNKDQKDAANFCAKINKPRTIAELCKERLRRTAKKIQGASADFTGDLGFRVFKLGPSQFRAWDDIKTQDLQQLQLAFESTETPLIQRWDADTLFYEILLQEGFPLHSRRQSLDGTEQKVWVVTEEEIEHRLFVCLADRLTSKTLVALTAALADNDILVCFDRALTDEAKAQLLDHVRLRVL